MDFMRARHNPAEMVDPRSIEWEPEAILAVDYFDKA